MQTRDVGAEIRRRVPELEELVQDVFGEQLAWVAQVISTKNLPDAIHVIACQAVNDLTDLLTDCLDGSGRPAMRAARSLYEHGVNAYSVLADPAQPDRYMAHLSQGPALLAELDPGAEMLSGSARKAYLHRTATVGRDASRQFEAAVRQYGPSFRRSWSALNLKDRASSCGMGGLYDFYKLGSLVAHGSAGGSMGTRRVHAGEGAGSDLQSFVTYRTGKALELCPIAMWGGVLSHLHVMQAVEAAHPSISASEWSQPLLLVLGLWSSYREATSAIDKEMWPEYPQSGALGVMAFTRTKRTRWFLHLPSHGLLVEAEPPVMEPELTARLDRLMDAETEGEQALFSNDQRWVTVAVPDVALSPKRGGKVVPATSLLVSPQITLGNAERDRP